MAHSALRTTDQAPSGNGPWLTPVGIGWRKGTRNVRRCASNDLQQTLFGGHLNNGRWAAGNGMAQTMICGQRVASGKPLVGVRSRWWGAAGWRQWMACLSMMGCLLLCCWAAAAVDRCCLCWCGWCGGRHCQWDINRNDAWGKRDSRKIWFRQKNVYLKM